MSNFKIFVFLTKFSFSGHNTGSVESGKKYRPLFLDHFDKKESSEIEKVNLNTFKIHYLKFDE